MDGNVGHEMEDPLPWLACPPMENWSTCVVPLPLACSLRLWRLQARVREVGGSLLLLCDADLGRGEMEGQRAAAGRGVGIRDVEEGEDASEVEDTRWRRLGLGG
jgi:hypothetical protein